jgi:hypothetical protein
LRHLIKYLRVDIIVKKKEHLEHNNPWKDIYDILTDIGFKVIQIVKTGCIRESSDQNTIENIYSDLLKFSEIEVMVK